MITKKKLKEQDRPPPFFFKTRIFFWTYFSRSSMSCWLVSKIYGENVNGTVFYREELDLYVRQTAKFKKKIKKNHTHQLFTHESYDHNHDSILGAFINLLMHISKPFLNG